MKPKTITIIYWILAILFCLAMLGDAYGGITTQKDGVDNMNHLHYPIYMMTIMGVAKILGVIALLQPKYNTIKEWAFSGFAISFIGACWSRVYMGDGFVMMIMLLIMLAIMFVYYYFWKRYVMLTA